MGFFRRDRPLHEQLAEEGGLDLGPEPSETGRGPSRLAGLMHGLADGFLTAPPDEFGNPSPLGEVGVHGVPRARRWDVVASARAELPVDEVHFSALPDGTLIVEEDVPDGSLTSLAEAIEVTLNPPYRAEAVKREDGVWAVAASRISVREFPETEADELELVEDGNVVIGRRLDGDLFEVDVTPL
jgi:hypothetical protein